jgi:hypothetical protein
MTAKMHAPDRHKTGRKAITIQLSEQADRDLIDCLEGLPPGARSEFIKQALRKHFAGAMPNVSPELDTTLGVIGSWLNDLQRHTDGQFRDVYNALANVQVVAGNGQQQAGPPVIESAPRLTEQDIARKADKMKKQKGQWT